MSTKENFFYIQNIIKKIGEDKKSTENFKNLVSEKDRFNFTKSECKNLSLTSDYNLEDFIKFEILANIMYKINSNPELAKEFSSISTMESLTNFVEAQLENENTEVAINKEDIEAFMSSLIADQIPDGGLESVSGGGLDDFLSGYSKIGKYQSAGYQLGQLWGQAIYGDKIESNAKELQDLYKK